MVMKQLLFAFYPTYVDWNHGVALLSAVCKNRQIETDLILLGQMDDFLVKINNKQYDYICFSCINLQDYLYSLPFIIAATQAGESVLLGGLYASRFKPVLKGVNLCIGDGELLPLFVNRRIKGVLNNYICENIEELPLPDYDLFNGIPYNRELPWFPETTKYLFYASSRGCPFRCRFCTIWYQQPQYQRIRYKVGEDLTSLIAKYNPDMIAMGDSLPPYYDQKWRDSWGSVYHPFVSYIRADIKEAELIWLYDHGLAACFFGVESGNEAYRNQILGKNLFDKDILRTVGLLKEMDVHYIASFIRDTPGETWEIQGESAKFAREIGCRSRFYNYENRAVV